MRTDTKVRAGRHKVQESKQVASELTRSVSLQAKSMQASTQGKSELVSIKDANRLTQEVVGKQAKVQASRQDVSEQA